MSRQSCLIKVLGYSGGLALGGWSILDAGGLPSHAAFQKIPVSQVKSCDLRLSNAADIPHQCLQYIDTSEKWSFWQTSLGVQFGKISKLQWQKLSQRYGNWHRHRSPYQASRQYTLLDFLPPVIQALDRHRFISETRSISDSSEQQLVTNCWATLYEILRLSQRPTSESPVLFITEAQPMLNLLRRISTPVKIVEPGDILLVTHRHQQREYLDHTAIAIDRQIVFEKAGTGDTVPYRLIDLGTIRQIWQPKIFTYEWRRPMRNQTLLHPLPQFQVRDPTAQLPFPHTMKYPIAGEKTIYFPMLTLPSLQQQNFQFQLPPQAYQDSKTFPMNNIQK